MTAHKSWLLLEWVTKKNHAGKQQLQMSNHYVMKPMQNYSKG